MIQDNLFGDRPTVLSVRVRGPFWALWAKSLTGFNLEQHCIRSLIGPQAKGLGPRTPRGQDVSVVMPTPQGLLGWYVCAVSVNSNLKRNAHLLAVPAPGETAHLEWSWGEATLSDARAVPIVPDFIDPDHPFADDPKFSTCRNWQAAWMIARGQLG